jgi:hypothetical protein
VKQLRQQKPAVQGLAAEQPAPFSQVLESMISGHCTRVEKIGKQDRVGCGHAVSFGKRRR